MVTECVACNFAPELSLSVPSDFDFEKEIASQQPYRHLET